MTIYSLFSYIFCSLQKSVELLVELMLYVHGEQLKSCRDGQLSYSHCSWASCLEAEYQYLAHILSPLTDNCSS